MIFLYLYYDILINIITPMKYILKYTYKKSIIDKHLLPWIDNIDDNIIIEYQIGIALNKYIITPFFIYVPYADCSLLDIESGNEIKLELYKYCYFRRIAIYNIDERVKYMNIENYNYDLSKLENCYVNIFDNNIFIDRIDIEFTNIKDDHIYPFIWLKGFINDLNDDIISSLVPGMPVYNINNLFVGIIYNIIDDYIYIIPYINIEKTILENSLLNIFIDLIDDEKNIISNIHGKKTLFEIGDEILSINNDVLNSNKKIYDNNFKIDLPFNTYIWYNRVESILIVRNNKIISISVILENLEKRLSLKIEKNTKEYRINKLIFCYANLLMFEWIIFNNIMPKCKVYLEYKINPYYKSKLNYLLVGIENFENHPINIQNTIKKYFSYQYEFGRILSISSYKSVNLENIKTIDKLIISNSNDEEIELNWLK